MLPVSKVRRTLSKMIPVSEIPPPTKSLSEIGVGAAKKTANRVKKVGRTIAAAPVKRARNLMDKIDTWTGKIYDDVDLTEDEVAKREAQLKYLLDEKHKHNKYLDELDPAAIEIYKNSQQANKRPRTEAEFSRRTEKEVLPGFENQALVEQMAEYARDAYAHIYYFDALEEENEEKAEKWAERMRLHDGRECQWLYSLNQDLLNTGDNPKRPRQGFVEFDPSLDAIIISFKGTVPGTDYDDVFTDAHATKSKISSLGDFEFPFTLKVHTGFLNRFKDLFPSVINGFYAALKKYEKANAKKGYNEPPTVYITGHSLGGALATICAVLFALMFPKFNIYLFAFEPPRSFTSDTMDELSHYAPIEQLYKRTIRTVNDKDFVTGLPGHKMGFSHFGDAYKLPQNLSVFKPVSKIVNSHFMADAVIPSIKDAPSKGLAILPSHGSGKLGKNTEEMKRRMAYVRSFRKKKTSRLSGGW